MSHAAQYAWRNAVEHAPRWDAGWTGRAARSEHHAGPWHGIGKWERDVVVELLRTGNTPEQNKVKGAMREAIEDGLKYLSEADLAAIADYCLAQPPIVHNVRPAK